MRAKALTLSLIYLLLLSPALPAEKEAEINSWQELFPDQVERIYIIMKDWTFFEHTDYYENKVNVDIGLLEEDLKRIKGKNYSIKDISVVIHNHLKGCRFSPEDRKQYRRLKRYGFNGFFLLYCHSSNEVRNIEDEK